MDIRAYLAGGKPLLFDGAMGTMMQRMGLQAGELPELLNMTHPEMIRDIHRQYVEAGSHVVSTNTFQASEYKLKGRGYTVEEIISRTTQAEAGLANEVADSIQQIFVVTEQTGESTRTTAQQVRDLARMAQELRQSVARFRIA